MQRKKNIRIRNLFIFYYLFLSSSLYAQINGGCKDCPAFDANGAVEIRGVKESIIGDVTHPVSERVAELIAKMTLEEKISQLVNESDSIPRLNLPSYNYWNECLHGVARAGVVTVFPQAINLASTWDTTLVHKVASAISTEARLKYLEIGKGLTYWSPTINMARDPRWGRNEETYGEDPLLTSKLGVSFVKGLQGDHPKYLKTVATIKHFVANNQENNRFSSSSQIPTKQLYEYYFPAYEACVKEANVQSVMTAYNAFNGSAPSASPWLLNDILRNKWGFEGFVVSDCGAIGVIHWKHRITSSLEETAALAVKSGCDLECGTIYKENLLKAVQEGLITEKDIDKAVSRLLTARFKLGEFDPLALNPYNHYDKHLLAGETFTELSYEAAVKSIVLLKNENNFLPIDKDKIKSVALIGPFSDNNYLGGYSGQPAHNITLHDGVKTLLGDKTLVKCYNDFSVIDPISSHYLYTSTHKKEQGLIGEYFNGTDFSKTPLFKVVDKVIGFEWGENSPEKSLPKDNFSIRWNGFLKSPINGVRRIGVYADGGVRLWLNNKLVIDKWDAEGLHFYDTTYLFNKELVSIKIEYVNRTGAATCILVSDFGNLDKIEKVKAEIAKADLVLMALGSDEKLARENRDLPSIYLPLSQEVLLKEIYKVNKKTALIFHTGNPLTSEWAAANIPAILQAWYPGQEAGRALANIIFGKENPSGKLPMTIYKSEQQIPDILDYDIWKGRTYLYMKDKPLYGFGHGLSYSDFKFDDIKNTSVIKQGEALRCSVKITNTSNIVGEEVIQVYVDRENSPVYTFPLKKLVAFKRISLQPGETKEVIFSISPRILSVWKDSTWEMLTGKYNLYIGGGQPQLSKVARGCFSVEK